MTENTVTPVVLVGMTPLALVILLAVAHVVGTWVGLFPLPPTQPSQPEATPAPPPQGFGLEGFPAPAPLLPPSLPREVALEFLQAGLNADRRSVAEVHHAMYRHHMEHWEDVSGGPSRAELDLLNRLELELEAHVANLYSTER